MNEPTRATETIPMLVAGDGRGTKGGGADVVFERVSADALAANLEAACRPLARAFANLRAVGDFALDKVTIGLEISGEGGVSFIGTAKVGAKAAITLEFSPPKPDTAP